MIINFPTVNYKLTYLSRLMRSGRMIIPVTVVVYGELMTYITWKRLRSRGMNPSNPCPYILLLVITRNPNRDQLYLVLHCIHRLIFFLSSLRKLSIFLPNPLSRLIYPHNFANHDRCINVSKSWLLQSASRSPTTSPTRAQPQWEEPWANSSRTYWTRQAARESEAEQDPTDWQHDSKKLRKEFQNLGENPSFKWL